MIYFPIKGMVFGDFCPHKGCFFVVIFRIKGMGFVLIKGVFLWFLSH